MWMVEMCSERACENTRIWIERRVSTLPHRCRLKDVLSRYFGFLDLAFQRLWCMVVPSKIPFASIGSPNHLTLALPLRMNELVTRPRFLYYMHELVQVLASYAFLLARSQLTVKLRFRVSFQITCKTVACLKFRLTVQGNHLSLELKALLHWMSVDLPRWTLDSHSNHTRLVGSSGTWEMVIINWKRVWLKQGHLLALLAREFFATLIMR